MASKAASESFYYKAIGGPVILSGGAASLGEAAAESKDPYSRIKLNSGGDFSGALQVS
jgi:hypothetical protein